MACAYALTRSALAMVPIRAMASRSFARLLLVYVAATSLWLSGLTK
jgi:hypothetical protein